MRALAKPPLALGFGAFFLCAVTCAHFDELFGAPLSLASDWIAGLALVAGGALSGRDWLTGRSYQLVGWSFMASLLLHSFLGNLEDTVTHAPNAVGSAGLVAIPQGPYTLIVGLLCAVSVVGLWATLSTMAARSEPRD
jgi:hypothetical protein